MCTVCGQACSVCLTGCVVFTLRTVVHEYGGQLCSWCDVLCVWRDFCIQVQRRQPLVLGGFIHRFVILHEGLVS